MERRTVIAAALGLTACLLLGATSSEAWEFEMGGSFNWTYEWYDQAGSKGFFGPYNVDRSGGATRIGNLNFWNGGQFDTNITTSADSGWSYFNVEFFPQIKVNEAIRVGGKYRMGTYRGSRGLRLSHPGHAGNESRV